jgi:hypothetical protein
VLRFISIPRDAEQPDDTWLPTSAFIRMDYTAAGGQ